jgi:hypothetical protein
MARKPGRTYRTSSGKSVDFGALLLANETAPAIGNMNVNARGDEIDPAGNITKTREQIMREYNELNTMVPSDDAIPEGTGITADDDWQDWTPPQTVKTEPAPPVQPTATPVEEPTPTKQRTNVGQMVENNPDRVIDNTVKTKVPSGGLAAAVAAAKEVDNKVQESQTTKTLNTPGVKRI